MTGLLFSNIIVHGCIRTQVPLSSVYLSLGEAQYSINNHIETKKGFLVKQVGRMGRCVEDRK